MVILLPGIYESFSKRWEKYQSFYIISDTHFGDEDLRAGIPERPSDEELVKQINSKVGRKDVLIHLGDVGDIEYAKQLRGYKILVCGNHDAGKSKYEEVFDEIYTGPVFIGEKLLLSHEPIDYPYALNIHGHVHDRRYKGNANHLNVCCDVIGYTPINLNQLMKNGPTAKIETIHRDTINKATKRKKRR